MTTSTPPDNTVLVLYPPKVIGQTDPVEPPVEPGAVRIGLSLAVYDLVNDGEGAEVIVNPPAVGTVDPGAILELWLENETAVLDSKTVVDPNARMTVRIPKGRLLPDRVNKLYYTFRRGSDNQGTSTPLLEILYNRIRPGLKDRLTDPGGHSELKLLLPDAIKNGVDQNFVSAEVCVAYPYCRAYDRISLKCNGELMTAKVNENQAPQPPNPGSEAPITICFTVDRAYLDKAKRLDKKLHFSYTVTDQLGNGPDTDAPWSPVQTVDEDLDGTLLPMPILLERMEDYPGDDASLIDLEKLAGNPLLLVVLTADNRFVVGYDVVATYTATVEGRPTVVTISGKVEGDPFGQKQTCILKVPNDKVLADSTVNVTYELRKPDGDPVGTSRIANAKVIGAHLDLKAPSIKEAPTGSLNPLDAKDTLTAVIPAYDNMIGTQITVTWAGTVGSGSQTVGPVNVTTQADKNIPLNNAVVAFNLDQPVTVTYIVIRNGIPSNPSPPLNLTVLAIADEEPEMGSPLIIQAANNGAGPEFDVSKLTTPATPRMNRYPLMALRQYVWMRLKGTKKDGTPYGKTLWQPPGSVTNATWISQGYWNSSIPLADLKNLKDASELEVEFKAGLGGSQVEGQAVTFKKRIYTVKAVEDVKPEITEARDSKGVIEQDGDTIDTAVTLTGTASKGQDVKILDGDTSWGEAAADLITGIWTKPVTGLKVGAHSFIAEALYGDNVKSEARSFTVHRALQINTADMNLHGYRVYSYDNWQQTGLDFVGNTETRKATDGVGRITYTVLNGAVASVDGNGKVIGLRNGNTEIIVKDQFSTLSYPVSVKNVFTWAVSPAGLTYQQAINWRNSVAGSIPLTSAWSALTRVYGPDDKWPIPTGGVYWMCDESGCPAGVQMIYAFRNGGIYCHPHVNNPWLSWCLRPY